MKDPGFVAGVIGWVIGFVMGLIIEEIKIVISFPEQLKKLISQVAKYDKFCKGNPGVLVEREFFGKARKLVESGEKARCFHLWYRYRKCKSITAMISEIEDNRFWFFYDAAPLFLNQNGQAAGTSAADKLLPAIEEKVDPKISVSGLAKKILVTVGVAFAVGVATALLPHSTEKEKTPDVEEGHLSMLKDGKQGKPGEEEVRVPILREEVHSRMTTGEAEISAWVPKTSDEKPAGEAEISAEVRKTVENKPAGEAEISTEVRKTSEEKRPAEYKPEDEVNSTNHSSFSRFKRNFSTSGTKLSLSLADLAKRIRDTIPKIKRGVDSFTANDPTIDAWFTDLDNLLENADKEVKQYRGGFISGRKTGKVISDLISEIIAHMQWGEVIIIDQYFKKNARLSSNHNMYF